MGTLHVTGQSSHLAQRERRLRVDVVADDLQHAVRNDVEVRHSTDDPVEKKKKNDEESRTRVRVHLEKRERERREWLEWLDFDDRGGGGLFEVEVQVLIIIGEDLSMSFAEREIQID